MHVLEYRKRCRTGNQSRGRRLGIIQKFLNRKRKIQAAFFLYENNKSIDSSIKNQISRELRVSLQHINSALVSAQNRERFYAHNFGNVPQPADKGIVLQDILESGITWRDKSYCIDASYFHGGNLSGFNNQSGRRLMVAEPLDKPNTTIRVCQFNKGSQGDRIYSVDGKAICISANGGGGGARTGLYACPVPINTTGDKARTLRSSYYKDGLHNFAMNQVDKKTAVAEQIDPAIIYDKPVCEVRHGLISIKKKLYKIKLPDGFYVIRKLSVTECCRLQTLLDDYCRAVSPSQGYRGIGIGLTADIIIHLLSYALKNVDKNEKIVVLSMYDGIATGRYCFAKMGFTNVEYYAFEIDKFAIRVAMSNFADIIQCGDAYQIRKTPCNILKNML